MSWPVFIDIGNQTINVANIAMFWEFRFANLPNEPQTKIVFRDRLDPDDDYDHLARMSPAALRTLIADAIAATAKAVARAEAEAIDEHREAVRARQTYFTKPEAA